jgi:phosphate transport system ATP-binding protein
MDQLLDVATWDAALRTEDLTVFYGDRLGLFDVSLAVPERHVTAIIGPSGSGKSSLLRCCNRMVELTVGARVEGSVWLHGEDIYAPGVDAVAVRRIVGMVFEKPNPFPKSVFENVAFGPRAHGVGDDLDTVVERALVQAGLWDEVRDRLRGNALELSTGQQQRLCIARALATEPDVLLLDEPCSALDPVATTIIEELIRQLAERYTIVIVTHNLQQAQRASDVTACLSTVVLDDGQRFGVLAEVAPTEQLFTDPRDPRTRDFLFGRRT